VVTATPRRLRLSAIGATAHAALRAGDGAVTVFAPLSRSVYGRAGGEIVWLGTASSTLHPRAMLTAAPLTAWSAAATGDVLRLDAGSLAPWTPVRPAAGACSGQALAAGTRSLLAARRQLGVPDGFGAFLGGGAAAFPLDGARDRASALARACAAGDAGAAADAAIALLGLGAGLTPSGDDFAGAAFFAQALLTGVDAPRARAWTTASARVLAAAPTLTHPISLALLSDLLHGEGHAPLHELATALADDAPGEQALDAARRLTRIGHSSGWDMLAGFIGSILGPAAFS
jgi:hypothetical protein